MKTQQYLFTFGTHVLCFWRSGAHPFLIMYLRFFLLSLSLLFLSSPQSSQLFGAQESSWSFFPHSLVVLPKLTFTQTTSSCVFWQRILNKIHYCFFHQCGSLRQTIKARREDFNINRMAEYKSRKNQLWNVNKEREQLSSGLWWLLTTPLMRKTYRNFSLQKEEHTLSTTVFFLSSIEKGKINLQSFSDGRVCWNWKEMYW